MLKVVKTTETILKMQGLVFGVILTPFKRKYRHWFLERSIVHWGH